MGNLIIEMIILYKRAVNSTQKQPWEQQQQEATAISRLKKLRKQAVVPEQRSSKVNPGAM